MQEQSSDSISSPLALNCPFESLRTQLLEASNRTCAEINNLINTLNADHFAELNRKFDNASKRDIATYCGELIAAGVEYKDIIRAVLRIISGHTVANESWLPTASVINVSDSLVHIPL